MKITVGTVFSWRSNKWRLKLSVVVIVLWAADEKDFFCKLISLLYQAVLYEALWEMLMERSDN